MDECCSFDPRCPDPKDRSKGLLRISHPYTSWTCFVFHLRNSHCRQPKQTTNSRRHPLQHVHNCVNTNEGQNCFEGHFLSPGQGCVLHVSESVSGPDKFAQGDPPCFCSSQLLVRSLVPLPHTTEQAAQLLQGVQKASSGEGKVKIIRKQFIAGLSVKSRSIILPLSWLRCSFCRCNTCTILETDMQYGTGYHVLEAY
jgi:hypothetical protein